ncbi:MAG TPA: DNA polymerase III subunit gamma/tau [Candidatus Binataceae bacterium]|nr:DNA polymerase III subunit gamma/tau [Candidatus Binataceae bacterium]
MADSSSHLVLARKWRPERFSDLVGQEYVTRTLAQAIASGRIAHAFLFTGIRGVGKTTAARILARCLNCERGPTPEPCGECAACVEIRQGRALDVVEIDGATYRKIDDARTIIENLSYRPARDRFKIYIIDEAHQLTDQAFNALLKTLEEPPAHVKFILATTEPQKVPETILSRLQRYDFRRIPFATVLDRLRDLARREGIEAEDGALAMLARESEGSMRDAERMLETAFALASGALTETQVADSLGVASRSRVYALAEAIINKEPAAALATVRELHSRGANLQGLGRDLLEVLRNLAVAKLPQLGAFTPLTDLPDHEAATLRKLAQGPSMRDLLRLFRLMAQAQEEILRSPYADLLLEMTAVRMATLAPVLDTDELARAVKALGGGASSDSGGGPGSGSRATAPIAPEPAVAPARRLKVEGEVKADAPRRGRTLAAESIRQAGAEPESKADPGIPDSTKAGADLPELRNYIRQKKAALAGFMELGAGLQLTGDVLRVEPRSDIYVRYLNDNKGAISALAAEHYGRPIKIELTAPAAEAAGAPPPLQPQQQEPQPEVSSPAAPPRADWKSTMQTVAAEANGEPIDREAARKELFADPLVRKILDELEGRLVDVRRPTARRNQGSEG